VLYIRNQAPNPSEVGVDTLASFIVIEQFRDLRMFVDNLKYWRVQLESKMEASPPIWHDAQQNQEIFEATTSVEVLRSS
jgi:hypothetical protein